MPKQPHTIEIESDSNLPNFVFQRTSEAAGAPVEDCEGLVVVTNIVSIIEAGTPVDPSHGFDLEFIGTTRSLPCGTYGSAVGKPVTISTETKSYEV